MLPPGSAYECQIWTEIGGGTYGNGEGRAFGSGANASDIAKFYLHIVSCEIIKIGFRTGLQTPWRRKNIPGWS